MKMELYLSNKPSKRFVIVFGDEKFYFGSPTGSTYIDHGDKLKRENYRKRHLNNPLEHDLITNLVHSPALFSYFISWGDSKDPIKNLKKLNALMRH
jgi:hypothetical protein